MNTEYDMFYLNNLKYSSIFQVTKLLFSPGDIIIMKGTTINGAYIVSMGEIIMKVGRHHMHRRIYLK